MEPAPSPLFFQHGGPGLPGEGSSVASWQDSETAPQEDKKKKEKNNENSSWDIFWASVISMKCLSVALELM